MKMKPSEIDQLFETCPRSLDPWSLEPLMSLAFLDPLIDHEETPLSEAKPPISFPDISLPLVPFNSQLPRNFDTGEVADGDVVCSCSSDIFPTDNPSAANLPSQTGVSDAQPILGEICKQLSPQFNLTDGKSILKQYFTDSPTISADRLVEEYLSLCSDEFFPRQISDEPTGDSEAKEKAEEEKKEKLDSETQATLEKRLRQSVNEVTSHAVLVSIVFYFYRGNLRASPLVF